MVRVTLKETLGSDVNIAIGPIAGFSEMDLMTGVGEVLSESKVARFFLGILEAMRTGAGEANEVRPAAK